MSAHNRSHHTRHQKKPTQIEKNNIKYKYKNTQTAYSRRFINYNYCTVHTTAVLIFIAATLDSRAPEKKML